MTDRRDWFSGGKEMTDELHRVCVHSQLVWIHHSAWQQERVITFSNGG
jgi:hypothetical protein